MKRILLFLLLVVFLGGCAGKNPLVPTEVPDDAGVTEESGQSWWKSAVFYEIFLRSFYDSDGDGIGDFKGLTEKLDYLNDGNPETQDDLGITALWLMPIHPSPSYHGYDVLDYYAINPDYGTMDDFKTFMDQAHQRGIRVIIDLVLNHTSREHPFFQDALTGEASPFYDWFIWSDANNGNGWHEVPNRPGKYYYGYFSDTMPDLNYENPEVTQEMNKVVTYWLQDIGVDGFRVDAVKHLVEEGTKLENTNQTHAWLKDFYPFYKALKPDAYVVGEVSGSSATLIKAYAGGQMDMIFNFEVASAFVNSASGGSNSSVNSAVTFTQKDVPDWNFATFLTNHDQNRVMSVLGGNIQKAKIAAALLLTSPGTPFIYYGEEIGMEGVKPDEDIRLPMQWDASSNAGFTTGTPWRSVDASYDSVNVSSELDDGDSLLRHYQQIIRLRQEHPALSIGNYGVVTAGNSKVYAALREYQGEVLLVLINLSDAPVNDYGLSYEGAFLKKGTYSLEALFGSETGAAVKVTRDGFTEQKPLENLTPYGMYIFKFID